MRAAIQNSCDSSAPRVLESASTTVSTSGTEVTILSEAGAFSCCDVWFSVPAAAWLPRVVLRLYGKLGRARVLLRQVSLEKAPVTLSDEGATASGVAISIRGRPCDGFELTAEASAGDSLTDGAFYLQLWDAAVEPSTAGGSEAPENETSPPLVAARILARNGAGELVDVVSDDEGRLLAIPSTPTESSTPEVLLLAAVASTSDDVFTRIATLEISPPEGVTASLEASFETSDPGNQAVVRLFCLSNDEPAGDPLSTSSTTSDTQTVELMMAAEPRSYELQLRLTTATPAARAVCTRARIILTPS